jgi:hypothetical protein
VQGPGLAQGPGKARDAGAVAGVASRRRLQPHNEKSPGRLTGAFHLSAAPQELRVP